MSAPLLFLIALLTPLLLAVTLLAPVYAGILGAAYIIYATGVHPHPLATKLTDVFYITDVYGKLFSAWHAKIMAADFVSYTLPLIGLPLLGIIIAFLLTRKLTRVMMDLFHLSASH